MERETKIALIITGSIVLIGAVSFGIYHYMTTKAEEQKNKKDVNGSNNSQSSTSKPKGNSTSGGNSNSSLSSNVGEIIDEPITDPNMVVPKYNSEKELINGFLEIKNQYLYPKRKEVGGYGYANIRSSTEVNTDRGWWDFDDNLITTINSGVPIGKVLSETSGLFNDYSYRWFKVKLYKPINGFWSDTTEGYVRADTVTFKPYAK